MRCCCLRGACSADAAWQAMENRAQKRAMEQLAEEREAMRAKVRSISLQRICNRTHVPRASGYANKMCRLTHLRCDVWF